MQSIPIQFGACGHEVDDGLGVGSIDSFKELN